MSGSTVQVVAEDLSMPYDKREQKKRAGQLASAMGLSSVDNVTIEGKVLLLMVLKFHLIYLQMKRLMRLML